MNKALTFYYLIIASLLGWQVISTVYQGSLVVFHSREIHQLQAKKKQLIKQQLSVQEELSKTQSLTSLSLSNQLHEYTKISQPLAVSQLTTVALGSL